METKEKDDKIHTLEIFKSRFDENSKEEKKI